MVMEEACASRIAEIAYCMCHDALAEGDFDEAKRALYEYFDANEGVITYQGALLAIQVHGHIISRDENLDEVKDMFIEPELNDLDYNKAIQCIHIAANEAQLNTNTAYRLIQYTNHFYSIRASHLMKRGVDPIDIIKHINEYMCLTRRLGGPIEAWGHELLNNLSGKLISLQQFKPLLPQLEQAIQSYRSSPHHKDDFIPQCTHIKYAKVLTECCSTDMSLLKRTKQFIDDVLEPELGSGSTHVAKIKEAVSELEKMKAMQGCTGE